MSTLIIAIALLGAATIVGIAWLASIKKYTVLLPEDSPASDAEDNHIPAASLAIIVGFAILLVLCFYCLSLVRA